MGRQIRSTVPQTSKQLTPRWPDLAAFRKQNAEYKAKQKANYDTRYRVRDSVAIPDDTEVWVTTGTSSEPVCGTVRSVTGAPRSYHVEVPSGNIRRNRSHIRVVPESPSRESAQTVSAPTATSEESTGTNSDSQPSNSNHIPSPHSAAATPRRIVTRSQTGNSADMPNYLRY